MRNSWLCCGEFCLLKGRIQTHHGWTPIQGRRSGCPTSSPKLHKTEGLNWVCSSHRLGSPKAIPEIIIQWQIGFWASRRNPNVGEEKGRSQETAFHWNSYCYEQLQLCPAGDQREMVWRVWLWFMPSEWRQGNGGMDIASPVCHSLRAALGKY